MRCDVKDYKSFLEKNRIVVVPYKDTKVPALKSYLDILDKDYEEAARLVEERSTSGAYTGILLGRPSGYLVMLDFDSEELGRLYDSNKSEARRLALEIAREAIQEIGLEPCLLVLSRRGFHLVYRMSEEYYRRLTESLNAYSKQKILVYTSHGYEFSVDVVLRGATPIDTDKHVVACLGSCGPTSIIYNIIGTLVSSKTYSMSREKKVKEIDVIDLESGCKQLESDKINKLAELISPYWVEGYRNRLELGLVGWCIKRGICKESGCKLAETIAAKTNDGEVRKRLYDCSYQYRSVSLGKKTIEQLTAKTGLIDTLSTIISEVDNVSEDNARARAIVIATRMDKIIGKKSCPYVAVEVATNTYVVNDPGTGIVLIKFGKNGSTVKYISYYYIIEMVHSSVEKEIFFVKLAANNMPSVIVGGTIPEIVKQLEGMPGFIETRKLRDYINAVIAGFYRNGCLQERAMVEAAGIYEINDELVLIDRAVISSIELPKNTPMARKALGLLVRIRDFYDHDKFDTVMQWLGYALAGYVLKTKYGVKQLYLYLHGEQQTGKTTLGRIISSMFRVRDLRFHGEPPEEGQSVFRLAWKLNLTTFPLLEDEVQGISNNKSLLGLIKRAATGKTVRWRGDTGESYIARSTLVMTSNYREVLEDPAIRERIIDILFTSRDSVKGKPRELREEFNKLRYEFTELAPFLGRELVDALIANWRELRKTIPMLITREDYLVFGKRVWMETSRGLGVRVPWADTDPRPTQDSEEYSECLELVDLVKRTVLRFTASERDLGDANIRVRLQAGYERGLLPSWLHYKNGRIVLLSGCVKELGNQLIGGLRNVCERCGWKYKNVKIGSSVRKACVLPIDVLPLGGDVVEV